MLPSFGSSAWACVSSAAFQRLAGTIGAVGNNGSNIVGVNWTASIMTVKWVKKLLTQDRY